MNFFICPEGAEPHIDSLNLSEFKENTFAICLFGAFNQDITLGALEAKTNMITDMVYEFNHQQEHWLEVENGEIGCVLIMAAILK